jgi:hypothetical protein
MMNTTTGIGSRTQVGAQGIRPPDFIASNSPVRFPRGLIADNSGPAATTSYSTQTNILNAGATPTQVWPLNPDGTTMLRKLRLIGRVVFTATAAGYVAVRFVILAGNNLPGTGLGQYTSPAAPTDQTSVIWEGDVTIGQRVSVTGFVILRATTWNTSTAPLAIVPSNGAVVTVEAHEAYAATEDIGIESWEIYNSSL